MKQESEFAVESNAAGTSRSSVWYAKYLETYPASGSFNSIYEISFSDEEPTENKKNKKKSNRKEKPSQVKKKISNKKQKDTAAQTDPQPSEETKKQVDTTAQTDPQPSEETKKQVDEAAQTDPPPSAQDLLISPQPAMENKRPSDEPKKQVDEAAQTDPPRSAQDQLISPQPAIEDELSICEHTCTMMQFPARPVLSGTLLLVGHHIHSDLFCLVLEPEDADVAAVGDAGVEAAQLNAPVENAPSKKRKQDKVGTNGHYSQQGSNPYETNNGKQSARGVSVPNTANRRTGETHPHSGAGKRTGNGGGNVISTDNVSRGNGKSKQMVDFNGSTKQDFRQYMFVSRGTQVGLK